MAKKPPENSLKLGLSILRAEAHGTPAIIATVIITVIVVWVVGANLLQR